MTCSRLLDPESTPSSNDSRVRGAATPESVAPDILDDHNPLGGAEPSAASVPWPGSTFIIRSVSSGHIMTLRGGQIMLAQLGGRGRSSWECVRSKGWFGFRDPGSGRFLGRDDKGRLCCSAAWHEDWERFQFMATPEGGYEMLMTRGEELWPVGIMVEQGVEKLARVRDGIAAAILWEFFKV
ncbi:MAG: hypothetical protein M1818_008088 [Claussenomyces sp. TS43310]|nr:MAG: hypothetical protein M1818_008088 [Claussenomyces sp. TS43310]